MDKELESLLPLIADLDEEEQRYVAKQLWLVLCAVEERRTMTAQEREAYHREKRDMASRRIQSFVEAVRRATNG